MASTKRLDDMTTASALDESEIAHVVQSGTNSKIDVSDLTAGASLPLAGTLGQVLTKQSAADGDADWQDLSEIPNGGTVGQELTKTTGTDFDSGWANPQAEPTTIDVLYAWMDSPNQSTTGTNPTPIRLDSVEYDTQSIWDAVNQRAQPTVAGYYLVTAQILFSAGNSIIPIVQRDDGLTFHFGDRIASTQRRAGGAVIMYANGTTNHFKLYGQYAAGGAWIYRLSTCFLQLVGPL